MSNDLIAGIDMDYVGETVGFARYGKPGTVIPVLRIDQDAFTRFGGVPPERISVNVTVHASVLEKTLGTLSGVNHPWLVRPKPPTPPPARDVKGNPLKPTQASNQEERKLWMFKHNTGVISVIKDEQHVATLRKSGVKVERVIVVPDDYVAAPGVTQ
jgi:hypothetical protein